MLNRHSPVNRYAAKTVSSYQAKKKVEKERDTEPCVICGNPARVGARTCNLVCGDVLTRRIQAESKKRTSERKKQLAQAA